MFQKRGAVSINVDEFMRKLNCRAETLIKTDFWNISTEFFECEIDHFNNMTYFLVDEEYMW